MSEIKHASGRINFEAESGYQSDQEFQQRDGAETLLAMVDELGRILTIAGKHGDAMSTLTDAIARTLADL